MLLTTEPSLQPHYTFNFIIIIVAVISTAIIIILVLGMGPEAFFMLSMCSKLSYTSALLLF